jgi:hypothetical protein
LAFSLEYYVLELGLLLVIFFTFAGVVDTRVLGKDSGVPSSRGKGSGFKVRIEIELFTWVIGVLIVYMERN